MAAWPQEFVSALEHVVGPQTGVAAVCIGPDDDMEQRREEILESVAKVDDGDGVVLLTDMFGGTPSNLAISVLDRANVEVIAGVNLPMLIKLASVRENREAAAAVAAAQEAGRKYINVASQLLADARQSKATADERGYSPMNADRHPGAPQAGRYRLPAGKPRYR